MHQQFERIYAALSDGKERAVSDALKQETKVHENSSAKTYRNNAASVLVALRKRPKAENESDPVGIMSEYTQALRKQQERKNRGFT
jgi:hypothetical protein